MNPVHGRDNRDRLLDESHIVRRPLSGSHRVGRIFVTMLPGRGRTERERPCRSYIGRRNAMITTSAYVRHAPLPMAGALSFVLGLIGFFSPCVMPLVPGYLAYLSSIVGTDFSGGERKTRKTAVLGATLFVVGFSTVFVLEGVAFGVLGMTLRDRSDVVQRVLGLLTILLGVVFLGGVSWLQRSMHVPIPRPVGLAAAPLVGAAFGVTWGPCLTPAVGAVVSMAYEQASAGRGAFLVAFYCMGLGTPFVAAAFGAAWFVELNSWMRRCRRPIRLTGALLLIAIGLALMTGAWTRWADWLRSSAR